MLVVEGEKDADNVINLLVESACKEPELAALTAWPSSSLVAPTGKTTETASDS